MSAFNSYSLYQPYGLSITLGIFFVYVLNKYYNKYNNIVSKGDHFYNIIILLYLSAFIGGKIVYFFLDYDFLFFPLNGDIFFGGFSLLGASFFGILMLLYYQKYNYGVCLIDAFLPLSIIFLHACGRIGCLYNGCCAGIIYSTISLHIISIFFYLLAGIIGFLFFFKKKIITLKQGLLYYALTIFFERFLFDPFRYDSIILSFGILTKYQCISLLYIITIVIILYRRQFYRRENL